MPNQKSSGLDLIPFIDFPFLHFADTAIRLETEKNFNDLKHKIAAAACW